MTENQTNRRQHKSLQQTCHHGRESWRRRDNIFFLVFLHTYDPGGGDVFLDVHPLVVHLKKLLIIPPLPPPPPRHLAKVPADAGVTFPTITLMLSTWRVFNRTPVTNSSSIQWRKPRRSRDPGAVNQTGARADWCECITFDAGVQPLALSLHLLLTRGFITHTVSFSNLSEATSHTPTTNKGAVSLRRLA